MAGESPSLLTTVHEEKYKIQKAEIIKHKEAFQTN